MSTADAVQGHAVVRAHEDAGAVLEVVPDDAVADGEVLQRLPQRAEHRQGASARRASAVAGGYAEAGAGVAT